MKKLFLSLVALIATTVSYAQGTLVATLNHGSEITMYYGTYALRDAYNAAASGDIINLSGGTFQAVNISKAITLRGVGIDDANPTYITNYFTVEIPSDDPNQLSMEGIRCSHYMNMKCSSPNAYFMKCQFFGVIYDSSSEIKNTLFANCKITYQFQLQGASTVQCVNSFINLVPGNDMTNVGATFTNCLLRYSNADKIMNCQFFNCILCNHYYGNSAWLSSTSTATNSLGVGNSGNGVFGNATTCHNCYDSTFEDVFKNYSYSSSYTDSQTFELTDVAKTTYLGNDGTEVGLYGGLLPYTSTPSYPQITKMNVAKKTTADGKLSVEIEVSAAQ